MTGRRTHSDILVASIILVGAIMLGALIGQAFALSSMWKAIPWFIAAFVAAQLARRVLPDLAIDETAIAAAVTIAIVMGISYQMKGYPLQPAILAPILVGEAGAIAGAFTARAREPIAVPWLVAGAGIGGFGGGILLAGVALLVPDAPAVWGSALLAGAFAGALVVAWFTPARGRHAALGLAVLLALLFGATVRDGQWQFGGLLGIGLGLALGGGGGALGAKLRSRRRKTELPEARAS